MHTFKQTSKLTDVVDDVVLASEVLTTVELVVDADDDVVSGNVVLVVTVDDEVVLVAPVDDVVIDTIGSLLGLFEGDRLGALVGCVKSHNEKERVLSEFCYDYT